MLFINIPDFAICHNGLLTKQVITYSGLIRTIIIILIRRLTLHIIYRQHSLYDGHVLVMRICKGKLFLFYTCYGVSDVKGNYSCFTPVTGAVTYGLS